MDNTVEQINNNGNDATATAVDTPNDVVMKALNELLHKHFGTTDYDYSIERASAAGDNYLGIVYRVKAQCQANNEKAENGPTLSLIIKVPPQNLIRRQQFFARPCFLRESEAYEQFLPLTAEFQASRKLNVQLEGFHEYPKCLLSMTEEMNEAIFMEDLCAQQFALFDRFEQMDCSHVALIMRTYAKLHAISFALRDQEPHKFQPFTELTDIFSQRKDDAMLAAYMESLKDNCLGSLHAEQDAVIIEQLKLFFGKSSIFQLLLEYTNGRKSEPYAVVCHGDCWNNNFLFKKNKHGEAVEARVIDWQIMRYASPVTDLFYFIFSCTTGEFRKSHYKEMLEIYYETLSAQIERLGSSSEKLFPRSAFEAELKSKGPSGLLFAMLLLPIITMRGEDTPDLEALSELVEAGKITDLEESGFLSKNNADSYNKRMCDVIHDVIDYGYL